MAEPVLSVRGLDVAFTGSGRSVPAVRGIDFDVHANEVLGIVGESGSGKSVTSLAITGLLPATAKVSGSIRLGGVEITTADRETLRRMRGKPSWLSQQPCWMNSAFSTCWRRGAITKAFISLSSTRCYRARSSRTSRPTRSQTPFPAIWPSCVFRFGPAC